MSSQNLNTTVIAKVAAIIEATSGIDVSTCDAQESFLNMGMDSLLLTQIAIQLEKVFQTKVSFRELLESYTNVEQLAGFLGQTPVALAMSAATATPTAPVTAVATAQEPAAPAAPQAAAPVPVQAPGAPAAAPASSQTVEQVTTLMAQHMAMMQSYMSFLQGAAVAPASTKATTAAALSAPAAVSPRPAAPAPLPATVADEPAKPFGAIARISKEAGALTAQQQQFYDALVARYVSKTKGSRDHTQEYRATHADPRVVTGFKPHLKELVYPLVMQRSKGAELWDIDGNQYIDLTCGFGSNFFGNGPDWLKDRLHRQIDAGFEIGPQHELAGVVSRKLTQYLGCDRVAFCNTGSEAVLGAVRIARTTTGRDKIVSFTGSYHGIIDEVIVRSSKAGHPLPAAPGIMPSAVTNMLVLDYGTDASLARIRAEAADIGGILVEGVQSRRPDFRPEKFIKELRAICDEHGIVLIFDEIITGFRTGRYGAQGYYGIKADLATYGKVIGAGIAIGVIAGKKAVMDALDGGFWRYGDQSTPDVGVTYFAGTFVRHPLALAAMDAVLDHLAAQPADLAQQIAQKADAFVERVNTIFRAYGAPWHYVNFGSMMKLHPTETYANLELLVFLLRERGIHTWDGFPNFLTTVHTDQQIDTIIKAFEEAVAEMGRAGFFPVKQATGDSLSVPGDVPPAPNACLGRGADGKTAWFVPDPANEGSYVLYPTPSV